MSTNPTPLLVSANEASRMLGISSRTLWSMTHAGEIPCVRLRGRVLYDPRDLVAWIDAHKTSAPAPASTPPAAETPRTPCIRGRNRQRAST